MTIFRGRTHCFAVVLLGFAFCAASCAFAQSPEVNPPQNPRLSQFIQAMSHVEQFRDVNLSPDGKLIVWTEFGHDGNGIRLAPLADPSSPRTLTACAEGTHGMESEPVFSPDGKQIAFFSSCTADHKPAIFLADVAGGAPHQLTELDGYAHQLAWSPDSRQLSFLYVEGSMRRPSPVAPEPLPSGVIGVEGIKIQRVAAVDASSGQLTEFTPENLYVYEYDWSPDSTKLAYTAAPPPGENNWWVAKLYTQTQAGPAKAIVDPGTVTGSLHGLQMAVPRWSPHGKRIAFIGGLMSDQGSTGGDIYVVPADGGQPDDVTTGRHATPVWFEWLDDHSLGIAEVKGGSSHLFAYDFDKRQESSEYNLTLPASVGAGSLEMRVAVSNSNNIAFVRTSFSQPPEVWAGDLMDMKQITHANDNLKPLWGEARSIDWTNQGYNVQGWLLLPAHYDPAKKYPLIVYVHGGPSAANMPYWPYPGYGPVPFSAMDSFVLLPNPRGSYGQGERFTQANRKDFGYGDLRDILAGVDAVEKQYPVDDHRVGITGWSYGGFMTMFAVTQTHRFRAAVSGAGLSDWLSYYGENSIDQWMIPFFGASVYDDPAVYAKSSAINYVKNVRTPTLMVVGDRDGECPAPQSFEFWHALHDLGVPTKLVVYPNEGHGFVKASDRLNVLERAVAWFQEYMPEGSVNGTGGGAQTGGN
jgi:dipeptidyl aminopeptidase/acylaminoacyl peptidase